VELAEKVLFSYSKHFIPINKGNNLTVVRGLKKKENSKRLVVS
jgi:hypothetical protein